MQKPENQQNVQAGHKPQKTLATLCPGQSGVVARVECEPALRLRLAELGLTPGCRVLLRRIAPLGDPVQISLRGYELCLRRAQTKNIVLYEEE